MMSEKPQQQQEMRGPCVECGQAADGTAVRLIRVAPHIDEQRPICCRCYEGRKRFVQLPGNTTSKE